MTPPCSTCGYSVEWVRSCHRGVWRLVAGHPEILTRGRYFFVSPDTPFFPGWTNLWSKEWVADAWIPPETPTLGETTEGTPPYDNGILGVALPPPLVLGSQDCLRFGESVPPPYPQRPLVEGIDAECWIRAGQPVPNGIPVLPWIWQRPEELPVVATGTVVKRWKNIGTLGRDARNDPGSAFPTMIATGLGGLRSLEFRHAAALFYDPAAQVVGACTAYLVGQVRNDGVSALTVGPTVGLEDDVANRLFATALGTVLYQDSDNAVAVAVGGGLGTGIAWWLWRSNALIRLGSTIGAVSNLVPTTLPTIGVAYLSATLGSPSTSRLCNVSELLVWDRQLSLAEHDQVITYLRAKYALP